ncbi:hypothetical protein [Pseudoalteromonas luteoviolacea]|uniref:hypothetical protein n=1 Tax=Pseudoalteromonas luteoviolacea TaxID=43657 RepID=UPI0007B0914A|nr:hypothetical protein [Pseudoalteromonas luteoviolacea]KZN60730.1 hypothetical protein N474_00680 [Pseudoalteromonas luteoviolacea CPMOR-2]TQF71712.1 hypothetical protein FLM44_11775 [Pseudoalteromonas luteoviolacea]
MKKVIFGAVVSAFFGISQYAVAGDQQVNCRTQAVTSAVYSGNASCYAGGQYISRYVHNSASSTAFVSQVVNGRTVSCSASVPFSHNETANVRKCDYTPQARVKLDAQFNSDSTRARVVIRNLSTDRDGQISKVEYWVDNVYQGTLSGSYKYLSWRDTFPSFSTRVKIRVTDNDGYTDISSTYIPVKAKDAPCWGDHEDPASC